MGLNRLLDLADARNPRHRGGDPGTGLGQKAHGATGLLATAGFLVSFSIHLLQ